MTRALLSFLLPLLWLAVFILYHTSVYSTFKVQNRLLSNMFPYHWMFAVGFVPPNN